MSGNSHKARFWVAFFLLSLFISLSAQDSEDWISQSVQLTINARFTEAESLLINKIARGDSTAEVYFFLSSLLNSKMTHYESQLDKDPFMNAIDKVIRKTGFTLKKNGTRSEKQTGRLLFYRGSAFGYRAFYMGQTGHWLEALQDGSDSINDLEQAVALDSTIYEAYLGIGVYQYWKSTKLKFLFWTPFVEDLRSSGIDQIKKAVHSDTPARYLALHQLVYILLDYGKMDEALVYARQGIEAFPESPFLWWAYAHTFYKRHEYPAAIDAYRRLLELVQNSADQNPMHILSCHARLAEIYYKSDRAEDCEREAELVFEKSVQNPLNAEGQKSVEKATKYLKFVREP